MRELVVFCEGSTEQRLCNQVLLPHLFPKGDGHLHAIQVANSFRRGVAHRGGISKYPPLKRDIHGELSRRGQNVYFTTLIDLYGLPPGFPGKSNHVRDADNPTPYVLALESAFGEDIGDVRFIPHLQLHEFETMLFSDPEKFLSRFEGRDAAVESLKALTVTYSSIELINDGTATSPSKRIAGVIPEYQDAKASAGPEIAARIGIPTIREKCPHFDQWLKRLETLDWKE